MIVADRDRDLTQRLGNLIERLHQVEASSEQRQHEIHTLTKRLHELEAECRARLPEPRWGFRNRLKWLLGMRLGTLWQYDARAIQVPASYRVHPPLEKPPPIAVVTPSLNQAAYLEHTLLSVLDQDYPALEYVVQDGASQDGSVDVLRRHQARLLDWESLPDRGQAHAINLGFARTSAEIMAYLNADDLLLPGALHYVADYFLRHPDIDVVYGHRVVIDSRGREIGRWLMPPHDEEVLRYVDFIPQETLFWRRRAWERIGGALDESFRFALDWDLLLRLQTAGARIVRLPRFLGAFRVHDMQKTSVQLSTIGAGEMDRLRLRCHGREVCDREIGKATRRYRILSAWYYRLYQMGVLRH